jgi:hypothetical protein
MKAYSGPPMTLGNAAAADVRLIVWCRSLALAILDLPHQTSGEKMYLWLDVRRILLRPAPGVKPMVAIVC